MITSTVVKTIFIVVKNLTTGYFSDLPKQALLPSPAKLAISGLQIIVINLMYI